MQHGMMVAAAAAVKHSARHLHSLMLPHHSLTLTPQEPAHLSDCAMQLAQHSAARHAAGYGTISGTARDDTATRRDALPPTETGLVGLLQHDYCTALTPTNTLKSYTCFIQRNARAASNTASRLLHQAHSTSQTISNQTHAGDTLQQAVTNTHHQATAAAAATRLKPRP